MTWARGVQYGAGFSDRGSGLAPAENKVENVRHKTIECAQVDN